MNVANTLRRGCSRITFPPGRSRGPRIAARTLAGILLATAAVVVLPATANADVYPCRRAGGEYRSQCADVTAVPSGQALQLQRGPDYGSTVPGTAYHDGDSLALACWTTGPQDAGGHGDTYWFEVFDPNDTSVVGYVNDWNLTTGTVGQWQPHLEECAGSPPASGKPYQCRRMGGEYRSWCANVTAVAADSSLPLQQQPDYDHGVIPRTAYHNGDPLALACWTTGPQDAGGHGDTYWFQVFDPNDTSVVGYVDDYNLTTGSPADWKPVVDRCTSGPPEQPQLRGDHSEAGLADSLANHLGHVVLSTVMRSHLVGPPLGDLRSCAYQMFDGNVMPPGDVVSDGFCWGLLDETAHSPWFDHEGYTSVNWLPQGISSTADATSSGTYEGGRYLAVSWHGQRSDQEQNYRSRVTFVDADGRSGHRRFQHVMLVRPTNNGAACEPVHIHAGGMAWYGSKLLVADDVGHGIRVFDLNDLARAGRRKGCDAGPYGFVLPQVGRYDPPHIEGSMRLNFLSLDREDGSDPSIVVGEYSTTSKTHTKLARYALDDSTRMLSEDGDQMATATESFRTDILNMQGALSHGGRFYISTSNGNDHGHLFVWDGDPKHLKQSKPWSKDGENVAYRDGYLWSLTELTDHKIVFETDISHFQ